MHLVFIVGGGGSRCIGPSWKCGRMLVIIGSIVSCNVTCLPLKTDRHKFVEHLVDVPIRETELAAKFNMCCFGSNFRPAVLALPALRICPRSAECGFRDAVPANDFAKASFSENR